MRLLCLLGLMVAIFILLPPEFQQVDPWGLRPLVPDPDGFIGLGAREMLDVLLSALADGAADG